MAYDSLMVFTGNANPKLAKDVVRHLNIHVGRATVDRFSDGEVPLYARVDLVLGVRDEPMILELELAEPSLYLATSEGAADRFADAIANALG